jgi:hypothetical protein
MNFRWVTWLVVLAFLGGACATPVQNKPDVEGVSAGTPTGFPPEPTSRQTESSDRDSPPAGARLEFSTDFSRHSVPYSEILSGGPPKDGIPAVDDPVFISEEEASRWLQPLEPVIFVQVGEVARAYPIQVLIWHEIVNDTVGGLPLTVTFCPLCNTAIAFERTFDGQVLDFGTTGRLRNSNLIMYDRQTETWWQQGTGEAIVGKHLGRQLAFYPATIIAWRDFAREFPGGLVLSSDTGYDRPYGRNPYFGYDDITNSPFLFKGETPNQLPAMERVLALEHGNETVAYAYSDLREVGVINDTVGGEAVVVFWLEGTASPLDTDRAGTGRDIGSASAFSPILEGELLTFESVDGKITDGSGSQWNVFGQVVSGPLEGSRLIPFAAFNHFWFDWVAFKPGTRVWEPQ